MPPDPREFISIQPLRHGFRVDVVAAHPDGPARRLEPVHWPSRELAEKFAAMVSRATGAPIIEQLP